MPVTCNLVRARVRLFDNCCPQWSNLICIYVVPTPTTMTVILYNIIYCICNRAKNIRYNVGYRSCLHNYIMGITLLTIYNCALSNSLDEHCNTCIYRTAEVILFGHPQITFYNSIWPRQIYNWSYRVTTWVFRLYIGRQLSPTSASAIVLNVTHLRVVNEIGIALPFFELRV